MTVIQAVNLNKIYPDPVCGGRVNKNGARQLHVLKDVNLKIDKSEFVVIVGPSGAGKSTLLHLAAGLDAPTSGSVIFNKIDLYKISDGQRAKIRNTQIGFVFQFYHLLPEFNVFENVMMPALIKGRLAPFNSAGSGRRTVKAKAAGRIEDRASRLLEIMGLQDRLTHRPNQLSGGQQQRVAIARALINSPEVLYCDEPTGNLDSKTGSEVMEVIMRLNREEGVTCVMVTHEEALARDADRVMHIIDGRILEES